MDISLLRSLYIIILVTVPAAMVGLGIYMAMRMFFQREQQMKLLEIRANSDKETRLLRLQAYERMVIFLERIAPAAAISRVLDPHMVNNELQLAVMRDIRSEYEHNLSQQLYISSDAWNLIAQAKDEIIKAVGLIANHMPADTDAPQVARVILESISKSGQMLPNQTALEYLKNEARALM